MKKRLRFIFLVAGLVAAMIVACQLYWVFYNYQTTRKNFIATANNALRSSIDEYELRAVKLPTSLQYARPSLTFMTRTIPDQDPIALDTPDSKRRFSAEFSTVAVDTTYLKEIKALVARLTSQQQHRQLNLDTLSNLFERELSRNHIQEEFRLSIKKGKQAAAYPDISCAVNYYKDPLIVTATLINPVLTLARQNLGPALVSTLLILLSAGCFIYMAQIISKQARLDNLKNAFINNITHELKTPLSILRTSNEALLHFGASQEAASLDRYLNINERILNELDFNIDRMIAFTTADTERRRPVYEMVELGQLISDVVSGFTINKNVIIDTEMENDPAEVLTDRYMIKIILNNLIDNAVKYSGAKPRIKVRILIDRDKWQLSVTDNGPGIAAEHLPYIYDKFYRIPTGDIHEIKGYGIGLSHVDELVKALKGKITAAGSQGSGTIFNLTFKN